MTSEETLRIRGYLTAQGTKLSPDQLIGKVQEAMAQLRAAAGPPGTSVVFRNGAEVPLPTDQIVFADDTGGAAQVGFGGMSFEGNDGGELVFLRVRDLQPETLLSPERGRRMTLDPRLVASIAVDGRVVWPQ
jgi:hypothetical protein